MRTRTTPTTTPVSQKPSATSATTPPAGDFRRGLWSMAFTELWERYSFYGLQGILSFYLLYEIGEGGLALDPALASGIVGGYGGAVYLSQILGAWLGDRLVSPQKMVLYGAVVITAGHVVLAFAPGLSGLGEALSSSCSAPERSRRTSRRSSASFSTSTRTSATATPDSRTSTWPSTSARWSARSPPGSPRTSSVSTSDSGSRPSVWPGRSSSTSCR